MSRPAHTEGGLRIWALGLSLLVLFASIGGLAHQAVGLDRSHRAAAEGVLRDYSAFAADQFARVAHDRLRTLTATILEPVACRSSVHNRRRSAIERTPESTTQAASSCATQTAVDGYFEVDPTTARAVFTTGSIEGEIAAAVSNLRDDSTYALDLFPGAGPPRVVGYRRDTGPGGEKRVVGFVAPAAILQPVFEQIIESERLLPGSLTNASNNREYVSLDIRGHGVSIYRAGAPSSVYSTERPIGSAAANLRVHLAINDAAASQLIIGGMPSSRLPVLLSLLGVSVMLLSIGAWQVQRERRLTTMRVDFVRSASHELRTPLAQIRLFTETLQLGRVRSWSEVLRSLAFVDQQTQRLSRLVENLLAFAHGGERRRAQLEAVELGPFIGEIVERFAPIARTHRQQVSCRIVESCAGMVDREWLTQVLLNLLDNATKYGPSGQTVSVTINRDDQRVQIAVDDQGVGIPAAQRARVFEPFVRLNRDHEQRTGGTGIGLSVASELVGAMGGTIAVEEAPSAGARFIIELPALPRSDASPLSDARQAEATDHTQVA